MFLWEISDNERRIHHALSQAVFWGRLSIFFLQGFA
jgi:hypothetical protein